jgi:hypothetical protein
MYFIFFLQHAQNKAIRTSELRIGFKGESAHLYLDKIRS